MSVLHQCHYVAEKVLEYENLSHLFRVHILDLEYKILRLHPHFQTSVPDIRSPRQQCDSSTPKSRALCDLQPLQHGSHHEHARSGESLPYSLYLHILHIHC